jgi:hypothetical protein
MASAEYLTVRDIARQTGRPFHVIKYAIAAHNIREAGRVGVIRLFTSDQLPAIEAALASTSKRRADPPHPTLCNS